MMQKNLTETSKMRTMTKPQIKTNAKCEHFCYNHCLKTQSIHGCSLVQPCNMQADYCVTKGKP